MRVAFLYNEPIEDPSHQLDDDPDNSPIVAALERAGHSVSRIACTLDLATVRGRLEVVAPDVVFNRVDSLGGSDSLQAAATLLLDSLRLPYTGCPTPAIVATASKIAVKVKLLREGLPTPGWITADGKDCGLNYHPRNPQLIVKSVHEHASFQIDDTSVVAASRVDDVAALLRQREADTGRPFFAEEFVCGREFNLSMWGNEPEALPAAEIDFSTFPAGKPRIVGHQAKWEIDSFEYDQTERLFDFPSADQSLLERLKELAIECWRLFGLRGYARVDFRVGRVGEPWILEINANPSLSPEAGFAVALGRAGIGYDGGIQRILELALAGRIPAAYAIV